MGNVINLNRFRKRAEREAIGEAGGRQPGEVRPHEGGAVGGGDARDQAKAHLDQHQIDREDQS